MFAYSREQIAYPQVEKDQSDQSGIASSEVRDETFIDIPSVSGGACRARLRFPGRRVAREFNRWISRGIGQRPRSDRVERHVGGRFLHERIRRGTDRRSGSNRVEQPVGGRFLHERRRPHGRRGDRRSGLWQRLTGRDQPRRSDGA
jgi:hypothetical protein